MIEITFRHDGHVTPNCYRFEEIDEETSKLKDKGDYAVGKLYIQKHVFHHMPPPDEITVKIKW